MARPIDFREAAIRLEKQQNDADDKRFGFPRIGEAEKRFAASAKTDADYKTFEAALIRTNARTTRLSAIRDGKDPDATPVHEFYVWRGEVEDWRNCYARQKPEPA